MALRRTPLHALHRSAGAVMIDFAGWSMPLRYGSQIEEHHAVRADAGMFDVSHMTIIDMRDARGGNGHAQALLRQLIANDVARLDAPGKALYGTLLNEHGGIVDDVIAFRLQDRFRVVANAATRERVLSWCTRWAADFAVAVEERPDLAMVAIQGPAAVKRFVAATGHSGAAALQRFQALVAGTWMIARTGYTGEDGLEVLAPGADAAALWQRLAEGGVRPIGFGARDTLRLEAGLNLYGHDMDETTSPLESNLGWTVAWTPKERAFIGRDALEAQRGAKPAAKLAGLALTQRGVMRRGMRVATAAGDGVITSGVFAPSLGCSVALARVPRGAAGDAQVTVRGEPKPARLLRPPFWRDGARTFE